MYAMHVHPIDVIRSFDPGTKMQSAGELVSSVKRCLDLSLFEKENVPYASSARCPYFADAQIWHQPVERIVLREAATPH